MTLLARIVVTPRPVLNDPQGRAVQRGLQTLGFEEVVDVRVGKYLEITLESASHAAAEDRVRDMCDRLLANQVIEDYRYEIGELPAPDSGPAVLEAEEVVALDEPIVLPPGPGEPASAPEGSATHSPAAGSWPKPERTHAEEPDAQEPHPGRPDSEEPDPEEPGRP